MILTLALLPWLLLLGGLIYSFRARPRLSSYPPAPDGQSPRVSVIVPARNEAVNVGACVATLMNSSYPDFHVIVVDDRSRDGTREIARAMEERSAGRLTLVSGEPLPEGWIGKSWACWQGFQHADGELLLFTDADTRHESELISRTVGAMHAEGADMVSVLPQQKIDSFWERLVMPHVLLMITLRFLDLRRVNRARRTIDIVANGQYMLVRREAYEAVGGHEAVRGEVVEDVRLAQRLHKAGRRFFICHAPEYMETRMYRSLRGIIEGWTKNLAAGTRMTVAKWLRPALPALVAAFQLMIWVAPPLVLLLDWGGARHLWALLATAISLVFWVLACRRFCIPKLYAALYPIGALFAAGLLIRSELRGGRVKWRGREYGGAPAAGG